MDYEDIPTKPMTGEEAREWIAKFGGREEYVKKMREAHAKPRETPKATVEKSLQEVFLDHCKRVAKTQDITEQELFKQNPHDYEKYVQLGRID